MPCKGKKNDAEHKHRSLAAKRGWAHRRGRGVKRGVKRGWVHHKEHDYIRFIELFEPEDLLELKALYTQKAVPEIFEILGGRDASCLDTTTKVGMIEAIENETRKGNMCFWDAIQTDHKECVNNMVKNAFNPRSGTKAEFGPVNAVRIALEKLSAMDVAVFFVNHYKQCVDNGYPYSKLQPTIGYNLQGTP